MALFVKKNSSALISLWIHLVEDLFEDLHYIAMNVLIVKVTVIYILREREREREREEIGFQTNSPISLKEYKFAPPYPKDTTCHWLSGSGEEYF